RKALRRRRSHVRIVSGPPWFSTTERSWPARSRAGQGGPPDGGSSHHPATGEVAYMNSAAGPPGGSGVGTVWAGLKLGLHPRIMGVLNVTPDSFSDGGDFADPDAAIAAGLAMAVSGADIIDVGGETTRPRSQPTSPAEEQRRILPVIRGLAGAGLRVSVDSRNAATMAAALGAGAAIVNDVSALG